MAGERKSLGEPELQPIAGESSAAYFKRIGDVSRRWEWEDRVLKTIARTMLRHRGIVVHWRSGGERYDVVLACSGEWADGWHQSYAIKDVHDCVIEGSKERARFTHSPELVTCAACIEHLRAKEAA